MPPAKEQRAIAGVLGALDDKIESNRRLESIAGGLIGAQYAVVTSDKPRAAATNWLKVEMGSPFSGERFSGPGTGRPLIRIRDLKTLQPQVWTTERRGDEKVITPGDVLVGMDAEFRSMLWTGQEGVLNQRVCRFTPKPGVARAFALLAIKQDLAFFERAKTGTTVIHLNKSDIDRFEVPELDRETHARFAQVTDPLVERWILAAVESAALAELRDALLPELLSGRLRVPEAEELVDATI